MGGRKEHAHVAALGVAEQCGTLGPGGIHDGPQVVHAHVKPWQLVIRHAIHMPVPRLSKVMSRENDARFRR